MKRPQSLPHHIKDSIMSAPLVDWHPCLRTTTTTSQQLGLESVSFATSDVIPSQASCSLAITLIVAAILQNSFQA